MKVFLLVLLSTVLIASGDSNVTNSSQGHAMFRRKASMWSTRGTLHFGFKVPDKMFEETCTELTAELRKMRQMPSFNQGDWRGLEIMDAMEQMLATACDRTKHWPDLFI